jgi:hypothetical protein
MPSMVVSSIAKTPDDVGDAGTDADVPGEGALDPHARLPATAAAAISASKDVSRFRALKIVTSSQTSARQFRSAQFAIGVS